MKQSVLLIASLLALSACQTSQSPDTDLNKRHTWWKESVVYQIYPRSYADSDGDGVGDLRGIIQHLDYIQSLGVDVVWLNPIFSSPNDDNGYDVSDYTAIMSDFGMMQDFDELLAGMHQRGIRVLLDLVVNHSSDEHRWFQASRRDRTNPYRDYYHWWPAEKGVPPHRHSDMDPDLSAWRYDSLSNAYYLHYFSRKQPDLNWENPRLRQEFYEGMRFWLDKGIDGFRIDAASYCSKDTTFPEIDFTRYKSYGDYYCHGPHVHDYLQEMYREVIGRYDCMTVGEGNPWINTLDFTDANRHEFDMFYVNANDVVPKQMPDGRPIVPVDVKMHALRTFYTRQDSMLRDAGWPTVILGNHDLPRIQSYWGDDSTPELGRLSSQALITFLMTMRGTVFFYGGDEIGMNNVRFTRIEDYNDIVTRSYYTNILSTKGPEAAAAYLEQQGREGRDNARTPMQWTAEAQAGFTTGPATWLKVNPNYPTVNVAVQEADSLSVLQYFRRATALRHAHVPALIYGTYALVDADNPTVFGYLREGGDERILVAINFSASPATLETGKLSEGKGHVLLDNYADQQGCRWADGGLSLRPWQAQVILL